MSANDMNLSLVPKWRRWLVQWDISHNAISLAFFAFTSMWQSASTQMSSMVSVPPQIWCALYYISCVVLSVAFLLFLFRAVMFPPAVLSDFHHPRLVNFFYMPVMIGALCVITTPDHLASPTQFIVGFYVLAGYQLALTLYLYGEWLFGSHPTTFIHPLVFMQTIGFFLTAIIGARVRLVDQAMFMFSVGCLFWFIVLITNFQHVARAMDKVSERPQPTFFLFIAPPAQAAIAIYSITAARDMISEGDQTSLLKFTSNIWPQLSEFFHYVDLFIYMLMFRLFPTFWTSSFSISWWAYIFPLSAAAGATIWRYRISDTVFWSILSAVLAIIACTAMLVVTCFTVWALATGRVPNNPMALEKYYRYYTGEQNNNNPDIESAR